ncbi:hypothetical protein ACQCN2_15050 [Brevibacillus ginsengisoli]|uniref:hypothetical protein n=1 Tax=Brevibacillus ginsengisoli TaxID=363854 RepID=UPI003CF04D57
MEKREAFSEEKDVEGLFQLVELINAKGDQGEIKALLNKPDEGIEHESFKTL